MPYEQKTQQSPVLGRTSVRHSAHSWKNRQASVGIASASVCPQAGHRSVETSVTSVMASEKEMAARSVGRVVSQCDGCRKRGRSMRCRPGQPQVQQGQSQQQASVQRSRAWGPSMGSEFMSSKWVKDSDPLILTP